MADDPIAQAEKLRRWRDLVNLRLEFMQQGKDCKRIDEVIGDMTDGCMAFYINAVELEYDPAAYQLLESLQQA